MHIEIDTSDMNEREAIGLVQLLVSCCPAALAALSDSKYKPGDVIAGAVHAPPPAPAQNYEQDGASGGGAEIDPAQAFAEPPALDPATAFAAPLAEAPPASSAIAPPPPPAASAAVDLDTKGLPWDARIHAATKGKNKDGSWTGKRNTPADTIASVTAELRALHPQTAAAPPPPAASSAAPTPTPPPPPAAASAPSTATSPPPSPDTAASPTPTPPPPLSAISPGSPAQMFADVMRKVTQAQTDQKITMAQIVSTILPAIGVAAMRDLMAQPDKIPEFEAMLEAYIA